jgi:DNA-binding transcriptional LysR family regulator
VRCTVDDIHTLLDLVHRGLGVALVPQTIATKPQAAGLAVLQLPADSRADWVVSVVTAPTSAETAAAVHLLELLTQ